MYKSNDRDYLPEELVKIEYRLQHPNSEISNRVSNSFRYYDLEPMGLGPEGKYFISLDQYIDLSDIDNIRSELEDNLWLGGNYLVHMTPFGLVPQHINGEKCLDSYLLNPEKYGVNTLKWADNITNYHTLKRYYTNHFNLTAQWRRILHLRKPPPFYSKGTQTDWNPCIQYFPRLKKLIDSLPFKQRGIGLIFRSNEDNRLLIHRDSYCRNHRLHHINISLSRRTRQVFIYDPINNVKHYLNSNTTAYTFNECDLHGADPQFDHLVLRVDGEFEDWFARRLGYDNGISFDWAYDRPQEFIRKHGRINIWTETDI